MSISVATSNTLTKASYYEGKTLCIPSCIGMEVAVLGTIERHVDSSDVGDVTIEILDTASLRYKRIVTKSRLDLVGAFKSKYVQNIICKC